MRGKVPYFPAKRQGPPPAARQATTVVTRFTRYDNRTNEDDFALLHDGIEDHLFLLPGFRLQKNNPLREIRTGGGFNYTIDCSYTYKEDGTSPARKGNLLFSNGANETARATGEQATPAAAPS